MSPVRFYNDVYLKSPRYVRAGTNKEKSYVNKENNNNNKIRHNNGRGGITYNFP